MWTPPFHNAVVDEKWREMFDGENTSLYITDCEWGERQHIIIGAGFMRVIYLYYSTSYIEVQRIYETSLRHRSTLGKGKLYHAITKTDCRYNWTSTFV